MFMCTNDQRPSFTSRRHFLVSAIAFLGALTLKSTKSFAKNNTQASFEITIRCVYPYPMSRNEFVEFSKKWKPDCAQLRKSFLQQGKLLSEKCVYQPDYMEVVMNFQRKEDWAEYGFKYNQLLHHPAKVTNIKASLGFKTLITKKIINSV